MLQTKQKKRDEKTRASSRKIANKTFRLIIYNRLIKYSCNIKHNF